MAFDLEKFKIEYERWVTESLPDYQAGKMEEIVKRYPFIVSDDIPWTPYKGRASEQTFALITSGGLFMKASQPSFDTVSIHGDPSMREIPKTVSQEDIGIAHAHYDHSLAEQDFNIIFPIHRLIELEQKAVIGKVTATHYSFSYVNDVVTLIKQTIPDLLTRLKADGVDVLLLVPV
jgi:glycine/betaine/sarcosine/D-proline reductase family selenoprotein B